MAEFDPLVQPQDSGNFENDFEKLDPLNTNQEELVSSTQQMDDDLYSPSPEKTPELEPLIDISPSYPVQDPVPDSPSKEESPPPAPVIAPSRGEPEEKSECWTKNVDPRVIELVLWRDPKKTGAVFGSTIVMLMSLACFSVLSVAAYLCLAALTVAISFVVYKKIMGAVQKTNDGHPFKQLLEVDISVPEDKVQQVADTVVKHAVERVNTLRRLFLVEDIVDSLKFGLACWVLTYVGAWFNGMTLIILGVIALFTLPKVYEVYQEPIDQYVGLFKARVCEVMAQIKSKIPMGKKKEE